jgi:hypothetical protein
MLVSQTKSHWKMDLTSLIDIQTVTEVMLEIECNVAE